DVREVVGIDPAAVVLDLDDDGLAVGPGADLERPLALGGLDGVENDVEERLVDLTGVAGYRGEVLKAGRHADPLPVDLVAEDPEGGPEGGVHVPVLELRFAQP